MSAALMRLRAREGAGLELRADGPAFAVEQANVARRRDAPHPGAVGFNDKVHRGMRKDLLLEWLAAAESLQ